MPRTPAPSVGERFGRWTVVGAPHKNASKRTVVACRCECGTEREVMVQSLRRRDRSNPSCGCWKVERARATVRETRWKDSHGLAHHPLYQTWRGMMRRCYNESDYHYRRWGARGIAVYPPWHDVRVFVAWMEENLGARPEGRSLDRIDNDRGYEPGNLRWATPKEQYDNATHLAHDPTTRRWISLL